MNDHMSTRADLDITRNRWFDLAPREDRPAAGLRMIDLFAGVGGFRYAFERALGAECVFSSEWDRFSQKTYEANWGEQPHGDITQISVDDIPDHDILTAGFPCQPFSIAGVSKRNSLGYKHGFEHPTQGTLFFNVQSIIGAKRPRMFLLENVKNLLRHDKGRTFEVILQTLRDELGYHVDYKVLDARTLVPQHRERVFIVGFRTAADLKRFEWPVLDGPDVALRSILDDPELVDDKYTLSDKLWEYLQAYAAKHRAAGNGFGFGLTDLDGVSRTLSARYHKDGSEILVPQDGGRNPRRLTPKECTRLMGYPDDFQLPVSDTQAYRQMGNSVAVPVVRAVATQMVAATTRAATPTPALAHA
jgi:DNA (cytosine-5)-methyltransferase 1